ncbi:MAG: formylglycine-generating enzyme family protein [Alphaproteobacteria bacterium]
MKQALLYFLLFGFLIAVAACTKTEPVDETPAVEQPTMPLRNEQLVNSDDVVWVKIPAGEFRMGCSPGDEECRPNEQPPHPVQVSAFSLTATEVTARQYAKVMGAPPERYESCAVCAVNWVSWDEAAAFCRRVGGRLPTEAEWEYAARAGAETRYYFGNEVARLAEAAWYTEAPGNRSHPVAQKEPNAFGLYDMLGNVGEWTADWYAPRLPGEELREDPTGPASGTTRVIRGGSFAFCAAGCRVSRRFFHYPDTREGVTGIRCARDGSSPPQ